ncbi:MAG: hypothetical protein CSA32_01805 [Desulfobulbus propionicus]|nr:MAG: hypothetical protein CSA32_01805 [Desulfobulbus propionicus]
MELLAPAGTTAAFEAAIEEGADAVYIGAPRYNARNLQRDISLAEIREMVTFAHERKRKIYIAMNSLIGQREMAEAIETLSVLAMIKPDALIVQDLGLAGIIHRYFPELVLHASTLMTVHTSQGVTFLENSGFERVVLARELSLADIRTIAGKRNKIGLEVFIHGAMCFSYSGLCLFSSMHGGKSSLKGECVQPCRRKYSLKAGKAVRSSRQNASGTTHEGYFFSMHDLSGLEYIEALHKAGVESLKIEGRLRPAEYVRKTVRAYRLCLDNLDASAKERQKIKQEAEALLDQAMGRKRTCGFLGGPHQGIIQPHLAGGAGLFLGKAKLDIGGRGVGRNVRCTVTLQHDISVGDRLRFQATRKELRKTFTVRDLRWQGRLVNIGKKGRKVVMIMPGSAVYRAGKTIDGILFRVDVCRRREDERKASGSLNTVSRKMQVDHRKVARISALYITAEETNSRKRPKTRGRRNQSPTWWVRLASLPPVRLKYPVKPHRILVPMRAESVDQVSKLGRQASKLYPHAVWCIPPVLEETQAARLGRWIMLLMELGFQAFQLGHVAQLAFFSEKEIQSGQLQLYGDYTINVFNAASLAQGKELGFSGMLFSLETDRATLRQTLASWHQYQDQASGKNRDSFMSVGMYVYGKPALFTSRVDLPHLQSRKKVVSPRGEHYSIERNDYLTLVRSDIPFTLLPYAGEMMAMGISYLVVDLSYTDIQRASAECIAYLRRKDCASRGSGNYLAGPC